MNLAFGLHHAIPATVTTAWGARWIFPDDMLHDRQDMKGDTIEPLKAWLNGGVIKQARLNARKAFSHFKINNGSCETVILYQDDTGIVVGNPNRSFGYLYVAAWLHEGANRDYRQFVTLTYPEPKKAVKRVRKSHA